MSHVAISNRLLIVVCLLLLLFGTAFSAAQSTHVQVGIDKVDPLLQEEDDGSMLGLTPDDWMARLPSAAIMAVIVIVLDAVVVIRIIFVRRRGQSAE